MGNSACSYGQCNNGNSNHRWKEKLRLKAQKRSLGVRKQSSLHFYLPLKRIYLLSKIATGCCAKFQVNPSCGGTWGSAAVSGRVWLTLIRIWNKKSQINLALIWPIRVEYAADRASYDFHLGQLVYFHLGSFVGSPWWDSPQVALPGHTMELFCVWKHMNLHTENACWLYFQN